VPVALKTVRRALPVCSKPTPMDQLMDRNITPTQPMEFAEIADT
jgi:hypothetical protein